MAGSQSRQRTHLQLVEPTCPNDLASRLTDPAAREEFERLTQALLDAAIEILDLTDGDLDIEANGDEFEGDDGI